MTALKASGAQGQRHAFKYVQPYIDQKKNLTLEKRFEDKPAGAQFLPVNVVSFSDKYYTVGLFDSESMTILNSKISKPLELVTNIGTAGFGAEAAIIEKLKQHGLMDPDAQGAGFSGGNDFHIQAPGLRLGGESKINLFAKFGAISLKYEDRWIISPKSRAHKMNFAFEVERAKANGIPLLEHLNVVWGDPNKTEKLPQIKSDPIDSAPAYAYFGDHNVAVLHVHSHGTYSTLKEDPFDLGLPPIDQMTGRFYVARDRVGGTVYATFRPYTKSLEKSPIDIMQDDHLVALRDRLQERLQDAIVPSVHN